MEIRVLRYFLTIAREGSITAAANYLNLTQPTLSRQIMDLEKELGQKLFIRTNHNITLTLEGLILRKRAEEIMDMVEKTQSEFLSLKQDIAGEIRIGSGESATFSDVAELMREIRNEYPHIRFCVHSGVLEDIIEKIDNGLLDFGIVLQPVDISKYNAINLPKEDTWGILMRNDCELAKKDFVTLNDLEEIPLIVSRKFFRRPHQHSEFARWFHAKQNKLNITATYTLFYNAAIMAEQKLGYAFVLDNLANTSKNSTLCFKELRPKMSAAWALIWKKYQVFSPASKLFLEKMQESFY